MKQTVQLNVIDFGKIAKLFEEEGDFDINIKQFLQDVIKLNYKIDKKNFMKISICIVLLIMPVEEIISLFVPRASILFKTFKTPLDEIVIVRYIISIITDEMKSYQKYIESKKYNPAIINDDDYLEINPAELWNTLKEYSPISKVENEMKYELVPNSMKRIKEVEEFIEYNDLLYRDQILKYLDRNGAREKYVRINYKKLKADSLFSECFIEAEARRVCQEQMEAYIVDYDGNKMDTYKLKENIVLVDMSDLEGDKFQYQKEYTNDCCIIEIKNWCNQLETILSCLKIIKQEINNETISNIVVILGDLLIEIDQFNNYQVQVICKNIRQLKYASRLEAELSRTLKTYSKIAIIPPSFNSDKLFESTPIDISIKSGIERLMLTLDKKEIEFSNSDIKHIVPFYDGNLKNQYIKALTKSLEGAVYQKSNFKVVLSGSVDLNTYLNTCQKDISFETILVTDTITGNFDFEHFIKILNKLYALQLTILGASFLKLHVIINCGDQVILENIIGKTITTKLIDSSGKFENNLEYKLESLINSEMRNQAKAISYLINKYR